MLKQHQRRNSILRAPLTFWRVMVEGRFDFDYDLMPVNIRAMSAAKRWNLLLGGSHLLYRQTHPRNMPLHMQFELTSYCNLHCPVCPTGSGILRRPPQNMDVALFERVLREVGPNLLTMSLWGWGESLLHPQFGEFLRIAQQYPVMTQVSTNGQNLDDEAVISALIDYPPTYLIVALDGLTDETNAVFRQGARLAPALEGVRRLAELKRERGLQRPVLHMRFIVMRQNEHEAKQAPDFARDHGFDLLTMRTLSIISTADETHRALLPESDEYRPYDYSESKRLQRDDYTCTEPFWFPTLLADGYVVPCIHDYQCENAYGVVTRENSFRDVWFSPQAAEVRRRLRGARSGFCLSCPYADRTTEDVSVQAFYLTPGARRCEV